jgi:hypothetical protein
MAQLSSLQPPTRAKIRLKRCIIKIVPRAQLLNLLPAYKIQSPEPFDLKAFKYFEKKLATSFARKRFRLFSMELNVDDIRCIKGMSRDTMTHFFN